MELAADGLVWQGCRCNTAQRVRQARRDASYWARIRSSALTSIGFKPGERIVARLSEYAEWAGIRARAAFPRERRWNPSRPVVSGGVGYPVAVELEQIVGCCH